MRWTMVREVAVREIRTRTRTTAFRVITGILLAAAIVGPIVGALWPDTASTVREVTIGIVDGDQVVRDLILVNGEGTLDVSFVDYADASSADIDQALLQGDLDLVLTAEPALLWAEEADLQIAAVVLSAIQQRDILARGATLGLGESEIVELLSPPEVGQRFVDQPGADDAVSIGVAFLGLMIAFNLPIAFGQLTMLSVVEEKSTRVIEVLLGHLRPRELLFGKVLGLGAMAVAQLAVVIGGLIAALILTDAFEVPASVWRFVPIILIALLGGLAIYNTLFALLGSLISRQEDGAQVILPTILPLMAGFFVGQDAVFRSADTALVKALTFFPLTAPMLLPVRVARDAIASWEVVGSLIFMAAGVWLLLAIAGRVYEFTLLHTGARVRWGQLVRLSRGAALE